MNTLPSLPAALEWLEAHWHENRAAPVRIHAPGTEGRHTIQGRPEWVSAARLLSDGPPGTERLGSPPFSHSFAMAIDARCTDKTTATFNTPCGHPGLSVAQLEAGAFCSICVLKDSNGKPIGNAGSFEKSVERFRYPMWKALLALQNALRPRRQPHPYQLILDLVAHDWDARAAARYRELPWDLAEALYLRAIRQLHGRYEAGPIGRPSWVDKSDSQRHAESA